MIKLPATRSVSLPLALAFIVGACGGGAGGDSIAAPGPAPVTQISTLRSDLGNPWGLAQLPDGQLLITQKTGGLVRVAADGTGPLTAISGVPMVVSGGQGGLLDVAVDPDFAISPWVYLSYSEAGTGGAGTAVARGRLSGNALLDVAVIFRQSPKVSGTAHFGSRLVFGRDKSLYITLGERNLGSAAQDLGQSLGKVVRINRDGSIPAGNPNLGAGALPGIWSYGHRNPQGAALHPTSGEVWVSEHGPQGGDEVNIARSGGNYGWPVKSYGCTYGAPVGDTCRLGGGVHAPTYIEPLTYWVPTSVAPAGLAFYTGAMFPEWQGQLFSGSLSGMALWRLRLSGNTVVSKEPMYGNLNERFRDVRQARDGSILILTDSGKLMRLFR